MIETILGLIGGAIVSYAVNRMIDLALKNLPNIRSVGTAVRKALTQRFKR